ncbi:MAG: rhomboid family intramembrane serine protease [Akkermansiaceae bacterium]|nr:rhomboid family intramembrane serine protease [Akkermansiaceae bacterium]
MELRALFPRTSLHRPGVDVLTAFTLGLLAVQVTVWLQGGVYTWVDGQKLPREEILKWAVSREALLEGRVWTVATHVLLHGGWLHFLLNGLIIYMVGGRVYHILGPRSFAAICGWGVLGGTLLHVGAHPNMPLVGASAAGMALLLALTGLSPESRMWPLPVSGRNLGRGLLLASLLLGLMDPALGIPGFRALGAFAGKYGMGSLFEIGHLYHFGGGLAGWFYVKRLMRRPVTLEELRAKRARREGAAVS